MFRHTRPLQPPVEDSITSARLTRDVVALHAHRTASSEAREHRSAQPRALTETAGMAGASSRPRDRPAAHAAAAGSLAQQIKGGRTDSDAKHRSSAQPANERATGHYKKHSARN